MRLKKLKQKLIVCSIILLSLVASSCASTSTPDVPVCREKDIDRGRCTKIVSGTSFEINETEKFKDADGVEKTWYELRPYFILVPIDSWAKIKAYFIKVCEKLKNCKNGETDPEQTIKNIDEMIKN